MKPLKIKFRVPRGGILERPLGRESAKIVSNRHIQDDYYKIVLDAGEISVAALPGQFVTVKIDGDCRPFLRRPFSVHRVGEGKLEILYAVVGEGTRILSQKKTGEYLDIIGPLGNGFDYSSQVRKFASSQVQVIVAGGMGVAPLLFLAEKLGQGKLLVLLGARTKKQVLCEKEFKQLGCEVRIATDDGSKGFKGKVSELLESILVKAEGDVINSLSLRRSDSDRSNLKNGIASPSARNDASCVCAIYACGPRPMLGQISRISLDYNIPAQISLEEHMSCSIGACMGCVVETAQGFKRVCKEGPVFAADELIF